MENPIHNNNNNNDKATEGEVTNDNTSSEDVQKMPPIDHRNTSDTFCSSKIDTKNISEEGDDQEEQSELHANNLDKQEEGEDNQDLNNLEINDTNNDNNINDNKLAEQELEDGEELEDREEDKDEGEVHSDDDDLEEGELKDDDDGLEHNVNHYQLNQHKLHHQQHQSTNKQTSYHSSSPSALPSALLPTPRLPPRSSQPLPKSSICRYFSSNACTWGDSCRFLHIATPSDPGSEFVDSIRSGSSSRGPPSLPTNQPPIHDRDHHHIRHFSYSTSSSSSYHELHQSPQSPLPPHATSGYSNYRRHHNTTPPPTQSPSISPSAIMSGSGRPPPPPLASSSMSSATRPYSSSSSTSAADYERRRRLAFEFAPRNDRREVPPPSVRDYPRAPIVNGPHYRDIHPREYHTREPVPHREYPTYPSFNQSSHRSSMSWSRSPGLNHRTIPLDARRPHSLKRHYQNEEHDESSWSDEGSSDDSLIGGASSDNSGARSNRSATIMGGTGTPTSEPLVDDERRQALLHQLEEVEEAIARKKAKHEVGEQE